MRVPSARSFEVCCKAARTFPKFSKKRLSFCGNDSANLINPRVSKVRIVASRHHTKGSYFRIRHHHFHPSIYGRCLRRSRHPPLAVLLCYEKSFANTFSKQLPSFHFTQKIPPKRHGNSGAPIPRSARAATGSRSCRTAAEANGVHHDEHWAAAGELLAEGDGPHLRAVALSLPSGGGTRALLADAWPLAS